MRLLPFCFIISLLCSCIMEIEIPPCNEQSYLVVNSLFCADSTFRVHVTKTTCFSNPVPPIIADASIRLYENGILVANLTYIEEGWYGDDFTPSEGNRYKIAVDHPDFGLVQAESTIPEKVLIDSAFYYFREKWSITHQSYLAEITVEFSDPDSAKRYYEILFEQVGVYNNVDYMTDPSIIKDGDWDFEPKTLYFTNEFFFGQKKTLRIDYCYTPTYDYFTGDFLPDMNRFVLLRTVSEEFFLARKSWTKHIYNQQNSYNAGDGYNLPFIGEPQQMYTNVQGGYGVFAGYAEDERRIYYIEE